MPSLHLGDEISIKIRQRLLLFRSGGASCCVCRVIDGTAAEEAR
jgi:hypothetical protein